MIYFAVEYLFLFLGGLQMKRHLLREKAQMQDKQAH